MTLHTDNQALQLTTSDLSLHLGQVLGRSGWHTVEQADANAFGATTRDEQWIHTDPRRAADGPFGRTIAHGYLTLSLATSLVDEVFVVGDATFVVNYGLDRVRFLQPVRSGSRVRASGSVTSAEAVGLGVRVGVKMTVEIDGESKPALVADTIVLFAESAPSKTEEPA